MVEKLGEAFVKSGFCATGACEGSEGTSVTRRTCAGKQMSPFTNRVINCTCKCHKEKS
jgi:hypothetical protein